jgi:CheY-like chemotaxis protein
LVPHSDEGGDALAGLRVLVVEDEALVAMLIEDALTDLGCEVVALVAGLDEALSVAAREPLDAAVLDVNLAGREVYPAADRLAARGVPFVFATGYGPQGIRDGYRDRPALQKPFEPQELARALTRAVRDSAAASAPRPQAV